MNAFRLRLLVLAAVLITPPALGEDVFDVEFGGGTMAEYVQAVRTAAGAANVVFTPVSAQVPVAPMRLTNVSLKAALELLEGSHTLPDSSRVDVVFRESNSGRSALEKLGELTIYRLEARKYIPGAPDLHSHVWSLAPILGADENPEPVLTAIEAALDLADGNRETARVRFHRETRLLLVRAAEPQIEVIDSLLGELETHPAGEDRDADPEAERREHEAVQARLTTELSACRSETEAMRRAVVAAETRAEVLRERIAALEADRMGMQDEIRRILGERDAIERRLDLIEIEKRGR